MPTGFDVESGSRLSPRLLGIVDRLKDYLKNCRSAGKVTPENPMSAENLCKVINSHKNINADGPDIRAMVNHLRRDGSPIGSGRWGYFWAENMKELGPTIVHMMERRDAIDSAISGLERSCIMMSDGQRTFF